MFCRILLVLAVATFAERPLHAQPIEGFLAALNAFQQSNAIELQWTIAAGNTCEGTFVKRSVNGSEPADVFAIGGICGAPNRAESYRFTDTNTGENGTYTYFLQFGSIASASIAVEYKTLWDGTVVIYFQPTTGAHRLRYENQGREYTLSIFSLSGNMVHTATTRETEADLPSRHWTTGLYVLQIDAGSTLLRKKFLVVR
jgi:hypothetical protein